MIIDGHAHLFRHQGSYNEDFLAECKRTGIDKICAFLSGGHSTGRAADDPNWEALALRAAHPDDVICFARADHAEGEFAIRQLRHCVEDLGMRGLKQSFTVKASDPAVIPLIEAAAALKVPILFHTFMGREVRPERDRHAPRETDVMELAGLARAVPSATIMMAHYNLGDWEFGVKAIKRVPNIYAQTGGSGIDSDQIEFGIRELGVERIIFGTDNSVQAGMGKILGARITSRDRDQIFGENILRLLTARGPLPSGPFPAPPPNPPPPTAMSRQRGDAA